MTLNSLKAIDNLISEINRDSYLLTRDDQTSIEWKLQEVKDYIKETYEKRGQLLK